MHRGTPHLAIGTVDPDQHRVQQRHDHKAAPKTKQHGGHTGQNAKTQQQQIHEKQTSKVVKRHDRKKYGG